MKVEIKRTHIKHEGRYPYTRDIRNITNRQIRQARTYFEFGKTEDGLHILPYGTEITLSDGTVIYTYEDDYGFYGTTRYYKVGRTIYSGELNPDIVTMVETSETIKLQFVGNSYKTIPMFT